MSTVRAGGPLVPVLKRVAKIQPRGEALAVTEAKAAAHARKRAGGVADHAARVVVVADPAEIKEYQRAQTEAPQIDKAAGIDHTLQQGKGIRRQDIAWSLHGHAIIVQII